MDVIPGAVELPAESEGVRGPGGRWGQPLARPSLTRKDKGQDRVPPALLPEDGEDEQCRDEGEERQRVPHGVEHLEAHHQPAGALLQASTALLSPGERPLPIPAQRPAQAIPPPPRRTPSPHTASSPARAGCRSPSPTARRRRTCDSPARVSLRTRSSGAFPSGSPQPQTPLLGTTGSDSAQPQRVSSRAGVSRPGSAPCPMCPLTPRSARGSLSPRYQAGGETPRGSPPTQSTAQPRSPPALGWQRVIVTFLKPGQVEGAGDVDGSAGAPIGPAGIHVECPVAEEPFQRQQRGGKSLWSDPGGMATSTPTIPAHCQQLRGGWHHPWYPMPASAPRDIPALGVPSEMWRHPSAPGSSLRR